MVKVSQSITVSRPDHTPSGVPHVEGVVFNRSALTLTCTSTGGPATEVVWTRNGQPVSTGYTLSQTVTDTGTGRYGNELRAADIVDLVGNFICTVSNNRGVSNTGSIVLDGESSHCLIRMLCVLLELVQKKVHHHLVSQSCAV